ncbi:MAG: peptidylprolyl isomerase [Fibrobacter sp.]|jgi:peptidyl-prolyl cis-trans isomerase D|nr:peptidylprolyl isomerase [Fibrobacter sp.]
MLTWINENAKWVIVIFAVGIIVGLLAMDRVPDQGLPQQYPVGKVNGETISFEEFDANLKNAINNDPSGAQMGDEGYAEIRSNVFNMFVQQMLLNEEFKAAGLNASVAEMKEELRSRPEVVRNIVGQEAQERLYMLQATAVSQEDAMQRVQGYISTLPQFLMDTTFDQSAYEQWLNTPAAYEWQGMINYERELKTKIVLLRQLQTFVGAGLYPTSLEARYALENRMTEHSLEVASVASADFPVTETIDSITVAAYFKAFPDSFFVRKDQMKMDYTFIPIQPTASDDVRIKEYAMTLYFQLTDTSSAAAAPFEEVARITSEDPGSAANGGLLGDYTAKGVWVPEFEAVAFALDSGAISEPVRTQFGYHIIQSHGKTTEDSVEKVKVSHILLSVTPSLETVDSLEIILEEVRLAVMEKGLSFAEAAQEKNLPVHSTGWLTKGEKDQISEIGYLKGLSSFAFANPERTDLSSNVSPVMRNDRFVVLANKTDSLFGGTRSLSLYFDEIRASLERKKSADAAANYLTSVAARVQTPGDSVEKVKIDSVQASFASFVPGVGFSNPTLYRILSTQKTGEWGAAVPTDDGAVMVKIISKQVPDEEVISKALPSELETLYRFGTSTLFREYMASLESSAKVENNLDLYYRD